MNRTIIPSGGVLIGKRFFFTDWLLAAIALVIALAGCAASPSPAVTPVASPTARRAPPPTSVPTVAASPTDGTLTLTWWTPEFFSPEAPQPAGSLLAQQVTAFEQAAGGKVRVSPVLKARYGKGGLLDFLTTAHGVAPGILPDLVALDVTELESAVETGMLLPLDDLIDEAVLARLYPFARSAGRFDDRLLAVQFIADLEHVAYTPGSVKLPPGTWDALLQAKTPYLFPLGSPQPGSTLRSQEDLQHVILSQYLSAGALWQPETRQLTLQAEPLQRLLAFCQAAAQSGILPVNATELTDTDAVWSVYAQGKAPMAYISARRYLAEREMLKNTVFAPAPGYAGQAPPIAGGWVLAIVTTDPVRQQAAADFIVWMLQPENAGGWDLAAQWLPTSPQALAVWGADPYYAFLDGQLARAVNPPVGAEYPQVAARIQKAVLAVIKGETGLPAAVETATAPIK